MNRLCQRGAKDMSDKLGFMAKRQNFKEQAASYKDGKKVNFVQRLEDLENRDYITAKKRLDAQEAADNEAERADNEQRKIKLKQAQLENFSKLITKHSQSVKEKK